MTFSNAFWWTKGFTLWFKFHWNWFLRIHFTMSQFYNVDQVLGCRLASLGRCEFQHWNLDLSGACDEKLRDYKGRTPQISKSTLCVYTLIVILERNDLKIWQFHCAFHMSTPATYLVHRQQSFSGVQRVAVVRAGRCRHTWWASWWPVGITTCRGPATPCGRSDLHNKRID